MTEESANNLATVNAIKDMQARLESGEVNCAVMRVQYKDGTYEDLAFGGTQEERDKLLAKLRLFADPLTY